MIYIGNSYNNYLIIFCLESGVPNEIIKLHTIFTYYTKEGKVEGASCIDLMIHNIQIIRALDPPALDSGPRLGPWYLRSAKMNGLHTHTHRGMRARSTHTTSSGVDWDIPGHTSTDALAGAEAGALSFPISAGAWM